MSLTPPSVLTLKFDQAVFDYLDGLRRQYFPPGRNLVPAHTTLFHALPGDQEPVIRQMLRAECAESRALSLQFPKLRFLGRGVAVEVTCPELITLRGRLAKAWGVWLRPQDRQGYRPHVTIQNKAIPDEARVLHDRLAATWEPFDGRGEGLMLWRYLGGPWELAGEFPFGRA